MKFHVLLIITLAWLVAQADVTLYQLTTAVRGVHELLHLPQSDIDGCTAAYGFFQSRQDGTSTQHGSTEEETEHVRAYYKVLNYVLAVADIEKMYIPPQIDAKQGLFQNQLLIEQRVFDSLQLPANQPTTRLLDIGCGRGRIAHHAASVTGARVSGFNIDASQIQNAIAYAEETGFGDRLDFSVGDHHQPFQYEDSTFDGAYSFQALWPFFKQHELESVAAELFRVLKPGARFSCSEYLLTPHFDWADSRHVELHKLFLPTLAATQSNYPAHVTDALERVGFKLILSAPSVAPAWPLTDQKTDLFMWMRSLIRGLVKVGLLQPWAEVLVNNLLLGGQAWADAEKAKLADLNWQIIVEKPV